jgi:hypothetical protein
MQVVSTRRIIEWGGALQVACGNFHNLALVRGGDVFAWGCARYGLLGVGGEHAHLVSGSDGSYSPTPVHVIAAGGGQPVTQVHISRIRRVHIAHASAGAMPAANRWFSAPDFLGH